MKKISSDKTGSMLALLPKALVAYLIYFIFTEIVISGGRFERDLYLWIVIFVLTVIVEGAFIMGQNIKSLKEAILAGVPFVVVFIALDYGIVNWLLEKNSLSIFKNWETITLYALALLIPTLKLLLVRPKKDVNQVDELLTNHKPTL